MEPHRVSLTALGVCGKEILSPFLFVVVMEALSRMLSAALGQGNLTGFSVGSMEPEALVVNHLMFADDTLIFCGA
jgi:hypothetical protein